MQLNRFVHQTRHTTNHVPATPQNDGISRPRNCVRYFVTALVTLIFLLTLSPVANAAPVQAKHLTVELVSRHAIIAPGSDTLLGLNFKLEAGWHVYWQNSGDSGQPPEVKWTLPPGLTAGAMQFPAPKRLPLSFLMDFGYDNAVLFPVPLHADASVKPGTTAQVAAEVHWLVCREVCIPGKANLTLDLPVATHAATNPAAAALFSDVANALPVPLPQSDSATAGQDPQNFVLTLKTGQRETKAEFFPAEQSQIANAAPQVVTPESDGLQLSISKSENLQGKPARLRGVVELSDGRNYNIDVPINARIAAPPPPSLGAAGLTRVALLAFLGGALLNLMPCVFPVLFLKGMSLVESHGKARSHARSSGGMYTLGILVSFWVIVAVLLLLRSGGKLLGWGFQFQSPSFVLIVALLLFFFGLSLAGQFDFGLSLTSAGGSLAARSGHAGSFFTGVLATVVATPCTAPFMGAAIGFALAQSSAVTFLIFTALALGLAAPYLLLTFFPGWMRFLPRPGAWMEVLKQACAIPIFATVIWLVWLYVRLTNLDLVLWLLGAFLLLAAAGWALGRWPARTFSSLAALLLVAAAVAAPLYAQHKRPAAEVWQPWSDQAVTQARADGKAVFVDFTAAWCLSCQFNERTVLNSGAVQREMDRSHVIRLRADWTHYDPAITQALAQLGRSGVPTYVVYPANPQAKPDVLPEALTQSTVVEALRRVASSSQAKLNP
jgi:thiol:disulfide interchange protein